MVASGYPPLAIHEKALAVPLSDTSDTMPRVQCETESTANKKIVVFIIQTIIIIKIDILSHFNRRVFHLKALYDYFINLYLILAF